MDASKFNISVERLANIWLPLHKKWPELEPNIFIDYQDSGKKKQFVFGYDSDEPVPPEHVSILFREKAIRVLAKSGFPPYIEMVRDNEWVVMFNNYSIMKQTIFVDVTEDDALASAIEYIINLRSNNKKE